MNPTIDDYGYHEQQEMNADLETRDDVLGIMRKQNEITTLLMQQQNLSLLPKREIPIYDGDPLELVRSCQHMPPERGYAKAKALLEEQLGNDQKVASAYMNKALSWPPIKAEDVRVLQD